MVTPSIPVFLSCLRCVGVPGSRLVVCRRPSRCVRSNMQRVLQAIRPRLYIEEPYNPLRRWLFRVVKHRRFDHGIMACIVVNTLLMTLEHDRQSQEYVVVVE